MIICKFAIIPTGILKPADNRWQTTAHGIELEPKFLSLLVKKRIIRLNKIS